MNGAATNPDCHVLAFAGAQVKKGLDVALKLGAENFGEALPSQKNKEKVSMFFFFTTGVCVPAVFWGGREGFHSVHNTDVAAELKHMACFFKMAVGEWQKRGSLPQIGREASCAVSRRQSTKRRSG